MTHLYRRALTASRLPVARRPVLRPATAGMARPEEIVNAKWEPVFEKDRAKKEGAVMSFTSTIMGLAERVAAA